MERTSDLPNQMECLCPADYGVGDQTLVETGQLAIVRTRKGQKVSVRDVSRI